jgi:hypothetical protein
VLRAARERTGRATGQARDAGRVPRGSDLPDNDGDLENKKISRARAAAKDLSLGPRYILRRRADKAGVAEVASKIAALADRPPAVPISRAGSSPSTAAWAGRWSIPGFGRGAAAWFPDDMVPICPAALAHAGVSPEADQVAVRMRARPRDGARLPNGRPSARDQSWPAEPERISARRKDRKTLRHDRSLLTRAGLRPSRWNRSSVRGQGPDRAACTPPLADARTARAIRGAAACAVDAIQTGSDTAASATPSSCQGTRSLRHLVRMGQDHCRVRGETAGAARHGRSDSRLFRYLDSR